MLHTDLRKARLSKRCLTNSKILNEPIRIFRIGSFFVSRKPRDDRVVQKSFTAKEKVNEKSIKSFSCDSVSFGSSKEAARSKYLISCSHISGIKIFSLSSFLQFYYVGN